MKGIDCHMEIYSHIVLKVCFWGNSNKKWALSCSTHSVGIYSKTSILFQLLKFKIQLLTLVWKNPLSSVLKSLFRIYICCVNTFEGLTLLAISAHPSFWTGACVWSLTNTSILTLDPTNSYKAQITTGLHSVHLQKFQISIHKCSFN